MTSSAAPPAADFSCAICFDTATEPVVTRCGHLFCWECLDHWLHSAAGAPECPVCKGRVDEHIAGDIIPLYGKGKVPANKPQNSNSSSNVAAAPPTAATTNAASTDAAAAADSAQEAFFSRPSAYSFVPSRNTSRPPGTSTAADAAGSASTEQEEQHHPRPSADRAPPRPRSASQNPQMQVHTHAMPFSVGSSIFFFGGGGGMLFSLFIIVVWAVYNYAHWSQWRRDGMRWYRRMRGQPVPEEPHAPREQRDGAAHPTGGHASAAAPARETAAASADGAAPRAEGSGADAAVNELPQQQVVIRNLIFSVLAVFVLFQLLLL